MLLSGGLFALFGSAAAGIDGAGALGCLTLPFVAALKWRRQLKSEEEMVRHLRYTVTDNCSTL